MRKRFSIHHLLPGLSLAFTLFIFAPVDQYLSNAGEFWFSLGDIAGWLALFAFGAFAVITLLSAFLPPKASVAFRAAVYACSFMAYIQGNLLVIDYGTLNGQEIDWAAHTGQYIFHGALWIAVIALFIFLMFRLRKKFRRILEAAACVLLATQIISLGVFLIRGTGKTEPDRYLSVKNEFSLSGDSNTLVFLLDAFDAHLMEDLLEKYPDETSERFADFTWYRNTVGGATRTKYAIPFILTGETNKEEQSYAEYLRKGFAASPLIAELATGKYDSGIYSVSNYVDRSRSDAFGNIATGKPEVSDGFGLAKQFMKLVAYRYLPSVFSRYFWMYTGDFEQYKSSAGEAAYSLNDEVFADQVRQGAIEATAQKPAFRFYHLKGPHAPFLFDEHFERVPAEETNEEKQALGSLKLVDDYLYEMRDCGLYDQATVIILADHGMRPHSEEEQTPLLMVKFAGQSHPFEISDTPLSYTAMPEILTAALQGKLASLDPWRTDDIRYFYTQEEENTISYITEFTIDGPALSTAPAATGTVYNENTLKKDRSYRPGTVIRFDEQDTARNYLVSGFSKNEGYFTWTDGSDAELLFELPEKPGALKLTLEHGVYGGQQRVEVWVNGQQITTYTAEDTQAHTYTVEIPAGAMEGKELALRLHLPDSVVPAEVNPNEQDKRRLGLSMASLVIEKP